MKADLVPAESAASKHEAEAYFRDGRAEDLTFHFNPHAQA